jgi:hypothetical protein
MRRRLLHGGWPPGVPGGWRPAAGLRWLLQKLAKVQELKSLFLRSADFADPLH